MTGIWLAFLGFILVLLFLDLGVFHRKARVVEVRGALGWSAVWIALGLSFDPFVYLGYENRWLGLGAVDLVDGARNDGGTAAIKYLTGYVVEKWLSVDNIFVIAMIFGFFAVPAVYQHRVLFWGIWEEANKRLGAEKPDLEKEIARIEGQMARAQWAYRPVLRGFRGGSDWSYRPSTGRCRHPSRTTSRR
jgi:hypothetical protein